MHTPGRGSGDAHGRPLSIDEQREAKFDALLSEDVVDLKALRALSWSGIPPRCRATVWPLLLGYLPPNRSFRAATLQRKRREFLESVPQHFDISDAERSEYQRKTLHQILIDVPRTSTSSVIFQCPLVQRALERVIYIWALRHPASGYVQGINDMVTPFLLVFLSEHLPAGMPHRAEEVEELHCQRPYLLAQAEADAFWCLSLLLDSVQDNYTFAQPGIQRMVFKLKELIARIDAKLHAHLLRENLHFIQFAFRWMNCLLLREFSLDLILRLWDTYLAEYGGPEDATEASDIGDGFAVPCAPPPFALTHPAHTATHAAFPWPGPAGAAAATHVASRNTITGRARFHPILECCLRIPLQPVNNNASTRKRSARASLRCCTCTCCPGQAPRPHCIANRIPSQPPAQPQSTAPDATEPAGPFLPQVLHVYVCVALLTHWSARLQTMEFQDLVIFLQHLPTSAWCNTDVAELLSQAYVFKALYHNAPSHLAG
jgi:hypothetical protein